ncbi:hypothetical protein J7J90_03295 [Candidatus Micrarchaeota archaeon]|nr:hypothetical protein [Candidatus Micrarchaeota archaeon]
MNPHASSVITANSLFSKPLESNVIVQSKRYLQIAFNYDTVFMERILCQIPKEDNIIIEVGTPYIKLEGSDAIKNVRKLWNGLILADIKTTDGAVQEVEEVALSGANAATVLGTSSKETIDLFIAECKKFNMSSVIDMIHVDDPLKVLRKLKTPPNVVELHIGRDEENVWGKLIEYRHVRRIRSKFNVVISAAGGISFKEAESAVFNGADIVVVNLVRNVDKWKGISEKTDITTAVNKFLRTLK